MAFSTDGFKISQSSNVSLRVPKGFFTVMEVLVRALLKNQPLDVFEYGARFYESLLQTRTDTGHDPAIHGLRTEDPFKFKLSAARVKHGKGGSKKDKKHQHEKSTVTRTFNPLEIDSNYKAGYGKVTQDHLALPTDKDGETGM